MEASQDRQTPEKVGGTLATRVVFPLVLLERPLGHDVWRGVVLPALMLPSSRQAPGCRPPFETLGQTQHTLMGVLGSSRAAPRTVSSFRPREARSRRSTLDICGQREASIYGRSALSRSSKGALDLKFPAALGLIRSSGSASCPSSVPAGGDHKTHAATPFPSAIRSAHSVCSHAGGVPGRRPPTDHGPGAQFK